MRNLSINAHFRNVAAKHRPRFHFDGASPAQWQNWHDEPLPLVRQSLGKMPARVPLNPELIVEWRADGLIKQKLIFDVEEGLSATAYVFRPENAKGPLPAILACHGHGPYGKDAVMGVNVDAGRAADIAAHNYDYGLHMAKAGFAVIAIDWRGFGERDDRRGPHHNDIFGGQDICNVHFIRAAILGQTVLGLNVHDAQCALDYLCQQEFVDPARIGVMGLSFGGTMTVWTSLADDRIKAADVICYSDRFEEFGMADANFCGSQITPGIYDLCDVAELQGLIAPRPLLVEIGIHDDCFRVASATACFKQVEKIYSAAGVRERLALDLDPRQHGWCGHKSVEFFRTNL